MNTPIPKFRKTLLLFCLFSLGRILPCAAQSTIPWTNLLAYWDFNDASKTNRTVDRAWGRLGQLLNGAAFTPDGGGRSGQPGDRAVDFGTTLGNAMVNVANGSFLNLAAVNDQFTISFWMKRTVAASTVFHGFSASSSGTQRGMSGHAPWSDDVIYFDTAGCCDASLQRIQKNINTFSGWTSDATFWPIWRHYAFVKNGPDKRVYIDGQLFMQGQSTSPLPADFSQFVIGNFAQGGASVTGMMDDFAVFSVAFSDEQAASIAQAPTAFALDTDKDGMPDVWELVHGFNPNDASDAALDTDKDGLTNLQEYKLGTDPRNPDTDGDGLLDGVETNTGVWKSLTDTGTDPLNADTDGDGLRDGVETNTGVYKNPKDTGTNPLKADTDGDGFVDGLEVLYSSNPNDAKSVPFQTGKANLVALWNFDNANSLTNSVDTFGISGNLVGVASYTADRGGHTGKAGDRAMDFGSTSSGAQVLANDPNFIAALNWAGKQDAITFSFWINRYDTANSSAFWAVSPASASTSRGAQVHVPYSDNNIYWDTGGAAGGTTRINANMSTFPGYIDTSFWNTWHHIALVKNGTTKQIWIDAQLFFQAQNTTKLATDFTRLIIGCDTGTGNIHGQLDDFAVYASALSPVFIKAIATGFPPANLDKSSNLAGIPDIWLSLNNLSTTDTNIGNLDPDNDGLTNLQEYQMGTDPNNPDTDGDGLLDGVETKTGVWKSAKDTGTDPLNPDTDGDGLLDGVETNTGIYKSAKDSGTNPLIRDTDGDGFGDGVEVQLASNPTDAKSGPLTPFGLNLLTYWDFNNASLPTGTVDKLHNIGGRFEKSAAYTPDGGGRTGKAGDRAVDFGGVTDGSTIRITNAVFLSACATNDKVTVSLWMRLTDIVNSSVFWGFSPSSSGSRGINMHLPFGSSDVVYFDTGGTDTTANRISANISSYPLYSDDSFWLVWHHYTFVKNHAIKQIWIDGNLFLQGKSTGKLTNDFTQLFLGSDASGNNIHGQLDDVAVFASALDASFIKALAKGTLPADLEKSTAGSGIPDIWLAAYNLSVTDASVGALDPDNDGLTNLQEYRLGTDPKNPDTDGDGLKDGVETNTGVWKSASDTGTDPLNPDTDGDGLMDGVETNTGVYKSKIDTGTNPLIRDTDGDGFPDGFEVQVGTDPTKISDNPSGSKSLLAYWDFNNASDPGSTTDKVGSFLALVQNGVVFTPDGGGRTGKAGDRSLDFGKGGTQQTVSMVDYDFLNVAATNDMMTFSLWVKLYEVANSSAFWATSPSSNGSQRGWQAHIPWGDGVLYFDTAGCCTADTQRISANISTFSGYTGSSFWTTWHHFAYTKNGPIKQIWIDGKLFLQRGGALPLPTDFSALNIGSEGGLANNIHGFIDDLAVFRVALDAKSIGLLASGTLPNALPVQVPVAPVPILSWSRNVSAGTVTVTWTGTLQSATSIIGPWADIPNVTSPLTLPLPPTGNLFVRARQ